MDATINGTVTLRSVPSHMSLQGVDFRTASLDECLYGKNPMWTWLNIQSKVRVSPSGENPQTSETLPRKFNQHDPDTFWRSGDDLKDLRELVDAAYTDIEIMDVSNSPYNQRWKAAWLKRAREFGATPEW